MNTRALFFVTALAPLLFGCAGPITGSLSGRAVPVPVMVGRQPGGTMLKPFTASGELASVENETSKWSSNNATQIRTSEESLRRSSLIFSWILMKGRLESGAALSPTEAVWIPQIRFVRTDSEAESHRIGESHKTTRSELSVTVAATSSQLGAAPAPPPSAPAPSDGAPR